MHYRTQVTIAPSTTFETMFELNYRAASNFAPHSKCPRTVSYGVAKGRASVGTTAAQCGISAFVVVVAIRLHPIRDSVTLARYMYVS